MNSGLFEVPGISSPRNYTYQMDIPVAKRKVQCTFHWECGSGVQGSFEDGHEREKRKRAKHGHHPSSLWAAGGRETGAMTEGQKQHLGQIQDKVIACSVLNQMSLNQ